MFSKDERKIVCDFIAEFNKIFGNEETYKNNPFKKYYLSEVYVWNKFTIQVSSIGVEILKGFSVEIYFDSEMLDYKNKVQSFNKYEAYDALEFARKLYKQNTDSLMVSTLSFSDC